MTERLLATVQCAASKQQAGKQGASINVQTAAWPYGWYWQLGRVHTTNCEKVSSNYTSVFIHVGSHPLSHHMLVTFPTLNAAAPPPQLCRPLMSSSLSSPPSSPPPSPLDEASAAALLVGTAIGGGFLALPYSTAPAGAIPSSATLGACWLVLVLESLLISDLVLDHRATAAAASDTLSEDSDALATPSFATLGNAAFGAAGGSAVGVTFVVLMITTLVSQLAKGSALLSPTLAGLPSGVRCALLAGTFGAFGRGSSQRLLSRVNGALALGFLASTASLFGHAVPLAYIHTHAQMRAHAHARAHAHTLEYMHMHKCTMHACTLAGRPCRWRRGNGWAAPTGQRVGNQPRLCCNCMSTPRCVCTCTCEQLRFRLD